MAYAEKPIHMSDAKKVTQSKTTFRQKTIGGYVVVHDGYKIDLPDKSLDSIKDFLYRTNRGDKLDSHLYSYWLGHLIAKAKPTYKRARCRWCDKYIKKKDTYKYQPDRYTSFPFHKKCYEIVRKKEGAKRFINEAAKDKEPSGSADPLIRRAIAEKIKGLRGTNTAP